MLEYFIEKFKIIS
jgi:hypothetical protein